MPAKPLPLSAEMLESTTVSRTVPPTVATRLTGPAPVADRPMREGVVTLARPLGA
ncbi:MAG: hypothetical protein QM765_10780 [Myxococcales bacterium]